VYLDSIITGRFLVVRGICLFVIGGGEGNPQFGIEKKNEILNKKSFISP
jgi:hypothetical protein